MKSLRSEGTNPRALGTNPRVLAKLNGGTIGGGITVNSKKPVLKKNKLSLTSMRQKTSHTKKRFFSRKKKLGWKPKRFPRLRTDRKILNLGSEILRATWNRLASEKYGNGFRGDVYTQQGRSWGEKSRHYFPILVDSLIQRGIKLSLYLKVMCNYGKCGPGKFMPDPGWLTSEKALEVYGWLSKKQMLMYGEHIHSVEGKPFDKRPTEHEILEDVHDSRKHLRKLIKYNPGLDLGCAAVFEWDHISPWYLALCKPFLELDGLLLVDKRMKREIKIAQRYFKSHSDVKKLVRRTAFTSK